MKISTMITKVNKVHVHHLTLRELSIEIDIFDMLIDGGFCLPKKESNLLLWEPHGLLLHEGIDSDLSSADW
jgi:hypothetical protein